MNDIVEILLTIFFAGLGAFVGWITLFCTVDGSYASKLMDWVTEKMCK